MHSAVSYSEMAYNEMLHAYRKVPKGSGDTRMLRDIQSQRSHNTHILVEKDEKQLFCDWLLVEPHFTLMEPLEEIRRPINSMDGETCLIKIHVQI